MNLSITTATPLKSGDFALENCPEKISKIKFIGIFASVELSQLSKCINLTELSIKRTTVNCALLESIISTISKFSELRTLSLSYNDIHDEGALKLLEKESLNQLVKVNLKNNYITPSAKEILLKEANSRKIELKI